MTSPLGRHLSLWRDLERPDLGPTAFREAPADVVVAGAGVTGLTAAVLLQQAGLRVVVVEAAGLGERAVTTRSTVKVTVGHGTLLSRIADARGEQAAAAYVQANQAGYAQILALATDQGIDCQLQTGLAHVLYAEGPDDVATVDAQAQVAVRLGLDVAVGTADALPFEVEAAVAFRDQAQLHPGQYLIGLAQAFQRDGGVLIEGTRVVDVDEGSSGCRVATTAGDLHADHVIVATQYPILDRGGQFTRTKAHRSYAIAGVLPEGTPAGMTINAGTPTHSTRTALADGQALLVVVGEGHEVGHEEDTEARWDRLAAWAAERFGVGEIRYHWSAQETESLDHVPLIGHVTPLSRRVLTATGFGGWGMTNGTAAALMMRDLILERDNPWIEVFDARRAERSLPGPSVLGQGLRVAGTWVKDHASRPPAQAPEDLAPGQAAVLTVDGERTACYRDEAGAVHAVSATCTHMGCTVRWNGGERSWDCPCHGSRFDPDGQILNAPATAPLPPRPLVSPGSSDAPGE